MPLSRKKIFLLLIFFLLVLFVFYYAYFHKRIDTVVKDRVYRSSQPSVDFLDKNLKEKGIKTILNLRGSYKDDQWYIKEREISKKYNVKHYDIQLPPHDLPGYSMLIKILDILSTSEKPVLIHCLRGVDRTGMVSALALAIECDPPLSEVKKQFSWRHGVLPFRRSIGPYFFSMYEQWLNKTQRTHNRHNLIYWITHEYVDNKGNLEFWIDHVNGKKFDRDNKIFISENSKQILIDGWAFDARRNSPAEDLFIVIDNKTALKANFIFNRPDVARYFSLGEKYYKNFVVGWKVEFERNTITDGCHELSLKLVSNSKRWDITTENKFCLKNKY
ncbi:MAG: hypothetical protein A2Y97_01505 [Nitrospirae bacterium RBG_13_39_12]|nr:MAG: hypothetical protein A2Y97_01505 [Nitrospirae bacterium RBG_13_39_12]